MYGAGHWALWNVIRYIWKVLECGAGERWTDCARNEAWHRARRRGISCIKYKEVRLNESVTFA